MRNVVLGLVVLLIGSVSGYTLTRPTAELSTPRSNAANSSESLICAGGASSDLDVDFTTASISVVNGNERARLRIELGNRGKGNTRATYALEFVDHHGNAIIAPLGGPKINIAASARVEAANFETPTGLADGFYIARATVVATGGGVDASELRHLYFEMSGGQLNEVDIEDYLSRSDANKGESL